MKMRWLFHGHADKVHDGSSITDEEEFEAESHGHDAASARAVKKWRRCKLRFSQICNAELMPDALLYGRRNDEAKCAWLRSQIIGSWLEIQTPFGRRRITYADYTASGRCLLHVENYLLSHVMPHYGNTHTEDSYVGGITSHLVKESSRFIKDCLGGTDDDALLFCGSGTTGAIKRLQEILGLTVSSSVREEMEWHKSWVVFIGPYEHHSNILSWRESLAEVVDIPMDARGMIDLEFLEEALEDPKYTGRPKLGSFSACSNVTGILTDTRRIALLLHRHEAFACFDFASSGPYVEIDMRSGKPDGYDAVFLSPHKFVGGPGTPGVLLMNKKLYLIGNRAPTTAGGGTVDFVNGFSSSDTLYVDDIEVREDAGTPQILQRIKAALAFWIKEEMGTRLIESREHHFITTAVKRLSANPSIVILGNTEVKRQAILSFLVFDGKWNRKVLQARFVVKLLSDLFGIQARGGCSCAGPYGHALLKVDHELSLKFRDALKEGYEGVKLGWCRVNFAYFLSNEEFEFILNAIEFVARYGKRLVPYYDFEWSTGNWNMKQQLQVHKQQVPPKGIHVTKVTSPFNTYLEEAKALVNHLSELEPPVVQRDIPKELDKSLVNFKL